MSARKFIASLCFFGSFALMAQQSIQYPYNPDVDNDEYIATSDLTGFLAQFGQNFQPAPVLIDSVDLFSVIQLMQAQITALQAQVASLEASAIPGLNAYLSVDDSAHTVLVSGANLQVVNGLGTDLSQNSLGNVIAGYNTPANEAHLLQRTGSHNVIVGYGHRYTGNCNLIGGQDNWANGTWSLLLGSQSVDNGGRNALLGGANNVSSGFNNVVVGGAANVVEGEKNLIAGGESNQSAGTFNMVAGGSESQSDGDHNAIVGGRLNQSAGSRNVVIGGEINNISDGSKSVVLGGEGNSLAPDGSDTRFSVVAGGRYNSVVSGYANSIFGGNYNITAPASVEGTATIARSIFGGMWNTNTAGYATTMIGGFSQTAQVRAANSGADYPADCVIGTFGQTFVGSTTSTGGQVITTAPSE